MLALGSRDLAEASVGFSSSSISLSRNWSMLNAEDTALYRDEGCVNDCNARPFTSMLFFERIDVKL